MGFWWPFTRREQRNSPERPSTSLANPDSWLCELWGGKSDSGVVISPKTALQIPTVWQCVTLLTDDMAKLTPFVYEDRTREGRVVAKTHSSYKLLRRRASQVLTSSQWRRTMLLHTLTHGNGYSWITFNGRGEPENLLILDPTRTEPFVENGELFYVTYIKDVKKVLHDWEVFHLRGVGFDGVKGYSIIEYAANSMGLTVAAEKYGAKHFANGTKVSGVLQYPGRLSPQAAQNLQASFQQRYEGLDNAHKTLLLEENAKFIPTTQTPNEAQYIELRVFQRKEIAAWFKIPPSKLGDPDSVSYNSLEQWNQAYLDSALDPWLCAFEEEAFDKLLTPRQKAAESHYVEFNRNALLRTDLESRYRAYAMARQWGWKSANDVLASENDPPLGKSGDVYLTPVNMTNAERMTVEALESQDAAKAKLAQDATKAKAKAATPPKAKAKTEQKSDDAIDKARPLIESIVSRAARRLVEMGRRAIAKDDWQDQLALRLNEHFQVLSTNVQPAFDLLAVVRSGAAFEPYLAVQQLDEQLTRELDELFDADDDCPTRLAKWDAWASRFVNTSVPATVDHILRTYA